MLAQTSETYENNGCNMFGRFFQRAFLVDISIASDDAFDWKSPTYNAMRNLTRSRFYTFFRKMLNSNSSLHQHNKTNDH
jgi:hypothetical protein